MLNLETVVFLKLSRMICHLRVKTVQVCCLKVAKTDLKVIFSLLAQQHITSINEKQLSDV